MIERAEIDNKEIEHDNENKPTPAYSNAQVKSDIYRYLYIAVGSEGRSISFG